MQLTTTETRQHALIFPPA